MFLQVKIKTWQVNSVSVWVDVKVCVCICVCVLTGTLHLLLLAVGDRHIDPLCSVTLYPVGTFKGHACHSLSLSPLVITGAQTEAADWLQLMMKFSCLHLHQQFPGHNSKLFISRFT